MVWGIFQPVDEADKVPRHVEEVDRLGREDQHVAGVGQAKDALEGLRTLALHIILKTPVPFEPKSFAGQLVFGADILSCLATRVREIAVGHANREAEGGGG